jgi:hypothetical protein
LTHNRNCIVSTIERHGLSRGMKYLAKTFTLPDVQVGSILEYFYTVDLSENVLLWRNNPAISG